MVDDRANVESKKGPFAARTSGEIGHDWPLPQRELSGDGGGGRGPPARAAEALSRVACSFEPINRSPKAPLVVVDFSVESMLGSALNVVGDYFLATNTLDLGARPARVVTRRLVGRVVASQCPLGIGHCADVRAHVLSV